MAQEGKEEEYHSSAYWPYRYGVLRFVYDPILPGVQKTEQPVVDAHPNLRFATHDILSRGSFGGFPAPQDPRCSDMDNSNYVRKFDELAPKTKERMFESGVYTYPEFARKTERMRMLESGVYAYREFARKTRERMFEIGVYANREFARKTKERMFESGVCAYPDFSLKTKETMFECVLDASREFGPKTKERMFESVLDAYPDFAPKIKEGISIESPKLKEMLATFHASRLNTSKFSVETRRPQLLAQCCPAADGGIGIPPPGNVRFVLDSGAAFHAVGEARVLRHIRPLPPGSCAVLPDGSRLCTVGIGILQCESFSVPDVHLIWGLRTNLISVSQLDRKHGLGCSFHSKQCQVMQADGTVVGGAILEDDDMYELRFLEVPEE